MTRDGDPDVRAAALADGGVWEQLDDAARAALVNDESAKVRRAALEASEFGRPLPRRGATAGHKCGCSAVHVAANVRRMEMATPAAELRVGLLQGVARNPAAPASVLRRLMRAPWAAAEMAWNQQRMTEELAAELLDLDDCRVAEGLARNQQLPLVVLRRLTTHVSADVRQAAVHELRHDEPTACCDLAAELAVLANDPSAFVRSAVAGHDDTPDDIRTALLSDPDADVRRALALGWCMPPPSAFRAMLTDPEPEVRVAALAYRRVPPADLHPALVAAPETRALVAPLVELTTESATELARDRDERVRAAVTLNPGLPSLLRAELEAEHNCPVRYAALTSPHTDHDTRVRLYAEVCAATDADDATWRYTESYVSHAWSSGDLAWLARSPVADRLAVLNSPLAYLRCGVAMNTADLPADAFARILRDPDPEVQRVAALYATAIRPDDLERIVREHGDFGKFANGIKGRADFPEGAYLRFATSEDAALREAAAARDLPPAMLDILAADPDPFVREATAVNPGLPSGSLARLLANHPSPSTAAAVGASVHLPREWMEALLTAEGL